MRELFLIIHILGGGTSLIAGMVAMLTKKGSQPHKTAGKVYFWGMTVACSSALYLSITTSNMFLLMIAFFSYQLVAIGYRALALKKLYTGTLKPQLIDWLIGIVPSIFNIAIFGWGAYNIAQQKYFGVTGLVFGSIGLLYAYNFIRAFYVAPKDKQQWMFTHFQGFGAAYIASATAFLVVNIHFLPPLLVWLAPSVVGATIITLTTIKYKRKFAKGSG